MAAVEQDLTLDRAADFSLTVAVDAALDLTGATAYGSIVDNGGLAIVGFTCTVDEEGQAVTAALAAGDTLDLIPDEAYAYDLFLVHTAGTERLRYGGVEVLRNFTKGVPIDPIT